MKEELEYKQDIKRTGNVHMGWKLSGKDRFTEQRPRMYYGTRPGGGEITKGLTSHHFYQDGFH